MADKIRRNIMLNLFDFGFETKMTDILHCWMWLRCTVSVDHCSLFILYGIINVLIVLCVNSLLDTTKRTSQARRFKGLADRTYSEKSRIYVRTSGYLDDLPKLWKTAAHLCILNKTWVQGLTVTNLINCGINSVHVSVVFQ